MNHGKSLYMIPPISDGWAFMKLDDFLGNASTPKKRNERKQGKKKRLRETSLEAFLPEEYVEYFKGLRIGSKKIKNVRIEEL